MVGCTNIKMAKRRASVVEIRTKWPGMIKPSPIMQVPCPAFARLPLSPHVDTRNFPKAEKKHRIRRSPIGTVLVRTLNEHDPMGGIITASRLTIHLEETDKHRTSNSPRIARVHE